MRDCAISVVGKVARRRQRSRRIECPAAANQANLASAALYVGASLAGKEIDAPRFARIADIGRSRPESKTRCIGENRSVDGRIVGGDIDLDYFPFDDRIELGNARQPPVALSGKACGERAGLRPGVIPGLAGTRRSRPRHAHRTAHPCQPGKLMCHRAIAVVGEIRRWRRWRRRRHDPRCKNKKPNRQPSPKL